MRVGARSRHAGQPNPPLIPAIAGFCRPADTVDLVHRPFFSLDYARCPLLGSGQFCSLRYDDGVVEKINAMPPPRGGVAHLIVSNEAQVLTNDEIRSRVSSILNEKLGRVADKIDDKSRFDEDLQTGLRASGDRRRRTGLQWRGRRCHFGMNAQQFILYGLDQ